MLDDLLDVFSVLLNVVFSEVDNRELVLSLEVRRLYQLENLHPVSGLQRVAPKILHKLNNAASLLDLSLNFAANTSALPLYKLVLRQFFLDVFFDFMD